MVVFDVPPEFEMRTSYRRRGISSGRSHLMVQRRSLWNEGDLRTFTLVWHRLNDAGVIRLRQLYAQALGQVKAMDFTPPGESLTSVRFTGPLRLTQLNAVQYSGRASLEEVR